MIWVSAGDPETIPNRYQWMIVLHMSLLFFPVIHFYFLYKDIDLGKIRGKWYSAPRVEKAYCRKLCGSVWLIRVPHTDWSFGLSFTSPTSICPPCSLDVTMGPGPITNRPISQPYPTELPALSSEHAVPTFPWQALHHLGSRIAPL